METPTSVRGAVLLVGLFELVSIAVTVLAMVFDDDLVAAWAGGEGLSADDQRVPPSFTPVVVVLFVVVSILVLVLLAFVRGGHNWARHSLAGVVGLVALAALSGIRVGPPTPFVVCGLISLVIDAALLACLWHPATTAFVIRAARRPESTRA